MEGAKEILLKTKVTFSETLKYIIIELHQSKYESKDNFDLIINKIISFNYRIIHTIEISYLFSKVNK